MNQLITITENNGNKAVSMKELYSFLEIKENWTDWTNRMLGYGFEKDIDYQAVSVFVSHENGIGGTNKKDYALTLDTAKEISMLQRSDKGKQARKYFIAIEKKATAQKPAMTDKNLQHHTLLALLKENLKRGDLKLIASENKFTYDAVRNIFYASSRRPEVIKAIFDRAMKNKKDNSIDADAMINQLSQLS